MEIAIFKRHFLIYRILIVKLIHKLLTLLSYSMKLHYCSGIALLIHCFYTENLMPRLSNPQ